MKVLTTNKIPVGDSVTLTVRDVVEGKFGANYIADINGEETEVRPSGNLKFLADDIANGKKSLGVAYTVTRVADKSGTNKAGKSFTASQFTITEAGKTETVQGNPVAAKLAAIRAKRSGN